MILLFAALAGILGSGLAVQSAPSTGGPAALAIDLVGVIVNKTAPDRSVCLLRSRGSTGSPVLAQRGDIVFHAAVVQVIALDEVSIKSLATEEIEILSFGRAARPSAGVAPVPAVNPAGPSPSPPAREQLIPKSVVDRYRANLKEVTESATAAPHIAMSSGTPRIDGFEIRSVKKGSIVEDLGFLVGDVIVEVNGTALDGLDKILDVYNKFKDADRVEIKVLRGGATRTLSFRQK